jgi:serine/threonine protein phosphatase PrpC
MCGRLTQDPEFCDHCNADLVKSGKSLPPERCPLGSEGATLTLEQRHMLLFPESSLVLPSKDRLWRVHWISDRDWRERAAQFEKRLALQIPALPPARRLEESSGCWLAFETASSGAPLWQHVLGGKPPDQRNSREPIAFPAADLHRLSAYVHSLVHALESLHEKSLVWLNFDPNALEDAGPLNTLPGWPPIATHHSPLTPSDCRHLRITNLDVELFPFRFMPERVRVHPQYAAPEVVQFRADDIGPRTDVYHLAMFAYNSLAGQLPDGLPGEGLEHCDFAVPFLRVFAPHLPEGIVFAVMRGLAQHPFDRPSTPRVFARALDEAILKAHQRRAFPKSVQWDIGGHTRAGRSKTELQRGNEDMILAKDDDHSALALVADGVSTCDVGSGGLASTMTAIVVENALADGCTHETFPDIIATATRRGSEGLLEWALAHGCRAALEGGKDLMGTTLTVGWLQGCEISLANLGDSRAYLITDDFVEQLTVDGDLASDLLARGAAPEEVKELGMMARALRECVGGCAVDEAGGLAILPESCAPRISRWPLSPGDVFVLCTDGLVEEGFFLEPATLADMVRQNKDRSASDLAILLAEAADAMQRAPSVLEPEGFGDNISCVVIKISG